MLHCGPCDNFRYLVHTRNPDDDDDDENKYDQLQYSNLKSWRYAVFVYEK